MDLPEETQYVIYQYRHQLEFKDVLDELIQHEINCKYNVAIDMLRSIFMLTIVVHVYVVSMYQVSMYLLTRYYIS